MAQEQGETHLYAPDTLSIVFLFLLPDLPREHEEAEGDLSSPKDAPYFYDNNIQVSQPTIKKIEIHGISVQVKVQIFDQQVRLAECQYTIPSTTPDEETVQMNTQIQQELKRLFLEAAQAPAQALAEEYTILLVLEKRLRPDDIVEKRAKLFSSLLRGSFEKPLDRHEIKKILSSRIRYSSHDMTVVDWNGAIILTDDGDVQADIDLLKIGNYQLMRYRMMDEILDDKFEKLKNIIETRTRGLGWGKERLLRDIVNQRLALLTSFDKLDKSLLLIGDWYSSQLYEVIVREFYINQWKSIVQNRLESLGSINDIVHQNFTLSWYRIIEFITFVGWFVMMVGYLFLFYIDWIQR